MALPKDHWIHDAVNRNSELRRRLEIPKGEKIPTKPLMQACRQHDSGLGEMVSSTMAPKKR